jgi:hypothetical protein
MISEPCNNDKHIWCDLLHCNCICHCDSVFEIDRKELQVVYELLTDQWIPNDKYYKAFQVMKRMREFLNLE